MKIGKIIYNTISALVLIVFVGLAILLVGFKLIGYTPYAVLSGSMQPLYNVGSVVYVKDVEPEDIKIDDVITFYMENSTTVVTHQVKEIDKENGLYTTQGLANDTPDGTPVTTDRIIGKVAFGVPYLGYISAYVTRPPWLFIIIALVVIWAIVVYMVDISKKDRNETKDKKTQRCIESEKPSHIAKNIKEIEIIQEKESENNLKKTDKKARRYRK